MKKNIDFTKLPAGEGECNKIVRTYIDKFDGGDVAACFCLMAALGQTFKYVFKNDESLFDKISSDPVIKIVLEDVNKFVDSGNRSIQKAKDAGLL